MLLFSNHVDCVYHYYRGGLGGHDGGDGENGTVTGKACPKGLYGIYCEVILQFMTF